MTAPVPDPARYADYRTWLALCLQRMERAHGRGAKTMLAAQMGCTLGHLTNILAGRRALGSPYLESLILALGLSEAQTATLTLLVAAAHGRPTARAAAEQALETARRAADPAPEAPLTPEAAPQHLLTLEALSLLRVADASPRTLAGLVWPPTTVDAISRLTLAGLSRRLGAPPGLRPLGPTTEADGLALRDSLQRSRLALSGWPLGRRLLRSSIGLTEEGWERAVIEEVSAFQQELASWAARLDRPRRTPCMVMHLGLQLTPLSQALPAEASVDTRSGLRLSAVVQTGEEAHSPFEPAPPEELPSTFAFDDYRAYLSAWFARKRALSPPSRPPFTMGTLAQRTGCSPSLISGLLSRARHLPEDHLPGLVRGLRLGELEARDLPLLWRYTKIRRPLERAALLRERMALPGFKEARPLRAAAMQAVSDPLHLTILELARHPAFEGDPRWIQERLRVPAPLDAIASALTDLQRVGALAPSAGGRLQAAAAQVWLESTTQRDLMAALHVALLDQIDAVAAEAPERVCWTTQALVVPLSAMEELMARVRGLHDRLMTVPPAAEPDARERPWTARLLTIQVHPGTGVFYL